MTETIEKQPRKPSLPVALIPFLCLILFMLPSVIILGADPQIPLIVCTAITALIGIKGLGFKWEHIEKSMIATNAMAMQANFIIMIVGCLVGIWIAGGVVPGMIYYGLKLFTPSVFLLLLPIICAVIAVSTGSAWTTAGTMGAAAMGIAAGLGIPLPLAAGAVVTGASFGDKLSPLSDSTNLAAGVAGANLFDHVRHMLFTTVPSFVIAVSIFGLIGTQYSADSVDTSQIQMITQTLEANFNITPAIFLAPLFVILMIVLKVPAIPGMFFGAAIGVFFAVFQGNGLAEIIDYMMNGFQIDSGNEMVDSLLNRGGLGSMMATISLVICALSFGGAVKSIGCLDTIISSILKLCHSRGSIMLANILTCISMNFLAADQYMAIVIPGQMYKGVYKKLNLHPKNLSRVLEDAGTLTSGIVPWSTCGAVYFATLGVSAFQYAPFCFLAMINPILSAVYGFTGITVRPLDPQRPIGKSLSLEEFRSIHEEELDLDEIQV